jgi:hypothetical protein
MARLLAAIEFARFSTLTSILVVPLFSLPLCQAFLLALWGATSVGSPWGRMAGLVAGTVYLEALLASNPLRDLMGMSTVTVTITTAALLVLRALGVRLTRLADTGEPTPPGTEGLRFSIRGLMLVTALGALLSAGARALGATPAYVVCLTAGWAICFVAVGLVALWAALGSGRPLWRGPIVFVLSPVLGVLFTVAAQVHPGIYFHLIMLLYPALLFGSLLLVRSCDFRFVRRVVSSSGPPDEQTGSLPPEIPARGVTAPE